MAESGLPATTGGRNFTMNLCKFILPCLVFYLIANTAMARGVFMGGDIAAAIRHCVENKDAECLRSYTDENSKFGFGGQSADSFFEEIKSPDHAIWNDLAKMRNGCTGNELKATCPPAYVWEESLGYRVMIEEKNGKPYIAFIGAGD